MKLTKAVPHQRDAYGESMVAFGDGSPNGWILPGRMQDANDLNCITLDTVDYQVVGMHDHFPRAPHPPGAIQARLVGKFRNPAHDRISQFDCGQCIVLRDVVDDGIVVRVGGWPPDDSQALAPTFSLVFLRSSTRFLAQRWATASCGTLGRGSSSEVSTWVRNHLS